MLKHTVTPRFGDVSRPNRYVLRILGFHVFWGPCSRLNDEGRLGIPESPSARTVYSSGLAEDGRILPLRLGRAGGARRGALRKGGLGCALDVCVTVHGTYHI